MSYRQWLEFEVQQTYIHTALPQQVLTCFKPFATLSPKQCNLKLKTIYWVSNHRCGTDCSCTKLYRSMFLSYGPTSARFHAKKHSCSQDGYRSTHGFRNTRALNRFLIFNFYCFDLLFGDSIHKCAISSCGFYGNHSKCADRLM